MEIEWKQEQSILYEVLESELSNQNIISVDQIIDYNRFKEFGLFSFLIYRLIHQQLYYISKEKAKEEKKVPLDLPQEFRLNIVGLQDRIKTIFLLSTANDKFSNPYLENSFIADPISYIPSGDGDSTKCVLSNLINYNISYLRHLGKNIPDLPIEESCESCGDHKEIIRTWIDENPAYAHVLGGWSFSFIVDPVFISSFESIEISNLDSFFNYFLSLYIKDRLNFDDFYPSSYLNQPFRSHEVDCFLTKNNTALIIETNIRFDQVHKDIQTKIYNMWALNKVYEKIILIYITFNVVDTSTHLSTFIAFHENIDHRKGSFEIVQFPSIFRDIDENLNSITKDDLFNEFEEFLEFLEQKIQNYLE